LTEDGSAGAGVEVDILMNAPSVQQFGQPSQLGQ